MFDRNISVFVSKTIRCKLIALTNRKKNLLDKEYLETNRVFRLLSQANEFGDIDYFNYKRLNANLYSLTKAIILFRFKPKTKEQPMPLSHQKTKIIKRETKLSNYWIKIPIYNVYGGIWCAIKFGKKYEELFNKGKLCDSNLVKRKNNFYAMLTFKKEIQPITAYSNILAVDLGEKVMATVCGSYNNKPLFFGKKIRGIRRHYAWLRKVLGEKKLLKKIKLIGAKENKKVDAILHEISQKIVSLAHKQQALIVLGDLKGIRNNAKGKGKRFNRIVHDFAFSKLSKYIEYKANWFGIQVAKINERGTSKTCSKCGEQGIRKTQGLFTCKSCKLQLNADVNGARNILKRSLDQWFKDGVIAYA